MPASEAVTQAPSRRDQHKSRTRQALREAALELFATKGFDETTTEEIAEQAGVSVRTFFRYFPTKELVLFHGRYNFIQAFTADFVDQPDSLSELDAMCAAFVATAPRLADRRKALLLYEKAVESSATLRGHEQDLRREDIATIAAAVAARRGLPRPDEECVLLAEIALLTYRRVEVRWLAGPARGDFAEMVVDEFRLLRELFTDA
jgi:AcrR family transcriptional regulator